MWSSRMKFRRKPVLSSLIDAEQYKPCMEDGFETRYQDVKKTHCTWEIPHSPRDIPVQVPFIITTYGKKFIRSDDWILTYCNDRKTLMHNKEFTKTYEKTENSTELTIEL
jgi:hypothetical protein